MPGAPLQFRTFTHDLKPGGDALVIDGPVIVRLVEKSGRVARLEISAPKETRISRGPKTDCSVRSNANTMTPSD